MTHAIPSRAGSRARSVLPLATLACLALTGGAATSLVPSAAQASALFQAGELDQSRFLLVAAPIGSSGERAQLNIYEQVKPTRPCYAVGEGLPAAVNPLLATFDFTGICGRYIDANGYSVRVGGSDLASSYRVMVTRSGNDTLLLAIPTRGAGPEMVVARTGGIANGFLRFQLEPGWRLMRRQFGGRSLGHVYLYTDAFPTGVGAAPSGAAPGGAAPAVAPPAAPPVPTSNRGGSPAPSTTRASMR
ncbi:MAG: DUF3747 domain-containing protein [Cyanobium sp.]